MKIPKKIYEKIDTKEVAQYYNYPQMNPEIKILGKNKEGSEVYDTLLNIISDDIDTSEDIPVCSIETTIDKDVTQLRTATTTRILVGILLSLILLKSYTT